MCNTDKIGDEFHFVMQCKVFDIKRACFIGKMESILPGFKSLSKENQFKTILCPTKSAAVKVTNQFIRILFVARDKLIDGVDITQLSYPTLPVVNCNCNLDSLSDEEDNWDIFDSTLDESIT